MSFANPLTRREMLCRSGMGFAALGLAQLLCPEAAASPAVNPLAPFSFFTASVSATTAAGTTTTQKVVSIWSLYAKNRSKGIVQPPSSIAVSPTNLAMTVTNYESTPLSGSCRLLASVCLRLAS